MDTLIASIHEQLPTGGSLKGTTLAHGSFGIRLLASARLTAEQLDASQVAIKRKLKLVKGAQVWMRVFPDLPVCVKGNETRMGKGKGGFEFWAVRWVFVFVQACRPCEAKSVLHNHISMWRS